MRLSQQHCTNNSAPPDRCLRDWRCFIGCLCRRKFLWLCIGKNKRCDIYRWRAAPGRRSGNGAPRLVRGPRRRQKHHAFWLHLSSKLDQNIAPEMRNKSDVKPRKSDQHINTDKQLQRFDCRAVNRHFGALGTLFSSRGSMF